MHHFRRVRSRPADSLAIASKCRSLYKLSSECLRQKRQIFDRIVERGGTGIHASGNDAVPDDEIQQADPLRGFFGSENDQAEKREQCGVSCSLPAQKKPKSR